MFAPAPPYDVDNVDFEKEFDNIFTDLNKTFDDLLGLNSGISYTSIPYELIS